MAVTQLSYKHVLLIGITLMAAVNGIYFGVFFEDDLESLPHKSRGFLRKTFVDKQGREHFYTVFIPFDWDPSRRAPVIVYMNGEGKRGRDGWLPLRDGLAPAIWEMKHEFPFVAVFPQSPRDESPGENEYLTIAILKQIERDYHTDPDRVYLTGLSFGGEATWHIARRNPGVFAAIAPISSGGGDPGYAGAFLRDGLDVWAFVVTGDGVARLENHRKMRRALIDSGLSPMFTELTGNGHDAWSFAFRNAALYDWLLDHQRSPGKQTGSFHRITADELTKWPLSGPCIRERIEDAVSMRCEAQEETAQLISPRVWRSLELHLDFRLRGLDRCGIGFLNAPVASNDLTHFFDFVVPESGDGGLFEVSTGKWLCGLNPAAQQAFVPKEWNDLRIRTEGGHVTAWLNGWKLLSHDSAFEDQPVRISLRAPSGTGSVDWRDLRVREIPETQKSP